MINTLSLNTAAMVNTKKLDISPRCSVHTLQEYLREEKGISVYCIPSPLSSKPNCWVWKLEATKNGLVTSMQQDDEIFSGYNDSLDKGLYEAMTLLN